MLWFNCEFRMGTGNRKKRHKTNAPPIHDFYKYGVCSLFKRGKGTCVKTLEVYNVKTLEVYNVKTLEVHNVKALEVYNVKY